MPQKNSAEVVRKAKALFKKGEYKETVRFIEKKLGQLRDPEQKSSILLTLAQAHDKLNDYAKGVVACQKAVAAWEQNDRAWYKMGMLYYKLQSFASSIEAYEKALSLYKKDYRYYLNLALLYREVGRAKEAVPLYEALLQMEPHSTRYMRNKISCIEYENSDNKDFDLMNRVILNPLSHAEDKMYAYFGLTKMFHDCGEYEKAAQMAIEGNSLRAKLHPFRTEVVSKNNERIQSCFTDFDWQAHKGHDTEKMLFIVGLSRSGKSLIESVLAQNPSVCAKHECCFTNLLKNEFIDKHRIGSFYPNGFHKMLELGPQILAQRFYSLYNYGVDSSKKLIVDTTPQNIEHIGLLKVLFPQAKFIICERNPHDQFLKIFMKYYVKGNNHSNNMQDIAFFHQQTMAMADFWQSKGIDCLRVRYEDFLEMPENTLNAISDYCGLSPYNYNTDGIHKQEVNIAQHYPQLIALLGQETPKTSGF